MTYAEKLIDKYPDATVMNTVVHINQSNFEAQRDKNVQNNTDGGSIGVVWLGQRAIVLVKRLGLYPGWALPGGTRYPKEGFDDTLIRESKEELELDVTIDRLLVLEKRTLVSPTQQMHDMKLAIFEATAEPGQQAQTTELARQEDIWVHTFHLGNLPGKMIYNDATYVDLSVASRNATSG